MGPVVVRGAEDDCNGKHVEFRSFFIVIRTRRGVTFPVIFARIAEILWEKLGYTLRW